MVRMMILADDFTGALDTGVMFSTKGIATKVFKNTDFDRAALDMNAEVLVINTNSRSIEPNIAYKRTREMIELAKALNIEYFFKKIDSGFRGNIGKELKAVSDGFDQLPIHLIPAYPDMNRTVINGISYINYDLLENSVFSEDPFNPVNKSYIPDIINEQFSVEIDVILQKDIHNSNNHSSIMLYDSELNEQIDQIVTKVIKNEGVKVFSGCAALGKSLANILSFKRDETISMMKSAGVYITCGSLNEITKNQVLKAQECGFTRISLNEQQKTDSEYFDKKESQYFLKKILFEVKNSHRVVVDSFNTRTGKKYNRDTISLNQSIIAEEVMKKYEKFTYVFTGGETLKAFMDHIHCDDIQIIGEIEEGVVVSQIKYKEKKYQIVSKSGGFGSEHVFCNIANYLIRKGNRYDRH